MKIFCKELNKHFDDSESMFKELVKHEPDIVALKKGAIKESDSVNIMFAKETDSEKALSFVKEGFVYPVINTTNFIDSHSDVHFPNIWNKTLKEKANKIFYVLEHKLSIDSVIAFPNDVKAFVKTVTWQELGLGYEGETQALIFEIPKDKIKMPRIKELFDDKTALENSVRMRYININLAIKAENPDYAKQNKLWKDRIDLIANKEVAEKQGYFWAVDEASIEKEGSLVLFGSNSATPIIYEAAKSTSDDENEPPAGTHTEQQKEFINVNLY